MPVACKDIDTWRSDKPLLLRRASTAANRRARLSLPYELEQMGGLGRTSSERHYLLGPRVRGSDRAIMAPVAWLELRLIPTVSACSEVGLAHNARRLFNQSFSSILMIFRTLLCLTLAAATSPLLADTVWLKNGDRLSGTIKFFEGKKLLLETEYGGSIALDWKKIATLESDQELLIKEGKLTGERAKALLAAEQGKVTLANGEGPRTIELASIERIMKPKPLIEDLTWEGNIDAALDYKRAETDTDDYDVDLKTQMRHGLWRHSAAAEYNREFQDGVVATDNWGAEYALDRFFNEHWFWEGRVDYKRDQIEELQRQRTVGTGPGYQFWDNELGAFSVAGLMNRTDYLYANGEKDNFYAVSAKWDYNRYLVGKSFELFSTGEVGKPLANVAEYALDAEVGLRYKVTDWASLNMKAEKDIVSGSEGDIDETHYSLGFGVGW